MLGQADHDSDDEGSLGDANKCGGNRQRICTDHDVRGNGGDEGAEGDGCGEDGNDDAEKLTAMNILSVRLASLLEKR